MWKKKKKRKVNEEEAGVDKISDLPNAILHHIFSFLNTDEAVRSSVFSKRWRYLWTSLPTLNFEYEDKYYYDADDADYAVERIEGLIDKVFDLRDGSSNITRFSLICPNLPDTSLVHDWVTSALMCNVQEMVIELDVDWLWKDPIAISRLFHSESLTFLRLVCSAEDNCLQLLLPCSVICLPSLKTLFLQNLSFGRDDCDESDDTNTLVSSCPVLESLTIEHCTFHENIKISSLSLKHLVFVGNHDCDGCVFKLITPNLISFKCDDYISNRYYLEDMSSLIKADIYIKHESFEENVYGDDDEYMPHEARRMLKFPRAFRNVKDLTLSGAILEVVSGDPELLGSLTSKFSNLKQLKLKISLSSDNIHAVTYFLKISPIIESLFVEISKEDGLSMDFSLEWRSTKIGDYQEDGLSMNFSLDHLKFVEIRGLVGCAIELNFLEILLKNAMTMEKLVVFTSKEDPSPDRERQLMKFSEKLLAFPRASASIGILFF